jgi:hypothetical protein
MKRDHIGPGEQVMEIFSDSLSIPAVAAKAEDQERLLRASFGWDVNAPERFAITRSDGELLGSSRQWTRTGNRVDGEDEARLKVEHGWDQRPRLR